MSLPTPLINVMDAAARKASRRLVRDFGEVEQLQVSRKGPGDFVTEADRRTEQILHEELSKARPGFGFLMEEAGEIKAESGDERWIIDPIDGTTNFLHGIPHFAISIGVERDDELVARYYLRTRSRRTVLGGTQRRCVSQPAAAPCLRARDPGGRIARHRDPVRRPYG